MTAYGRHLSSESRMCYAHTFTRIGRDVNVFSHAISAHVALRRKGKIALREKSGRGGTEGNDTVAAAVELHVAGSFCIIATVVSAATSTYTWRQNS